MVFGALVLLTIITVITARIDIGMFNVPLALAIASTKAFLVISIFMALRYDNRVNSLILAIGSVFVLVFLALTLSDTSLRGFLGIMPAGEIDTVVQEGGNTDSVSVAGETDTTPPPVAADGAELFTRYLCNTCHSLDGTAGAGPTLQGIGVQQSREEIMISLTDPDAIIVEGFGPGVMGATLNVLGFQNVTDEELEALVTYIQEQ